MFELSKLGGHLLSPLTMALGLGLLAAMCLALRRRAWALRLAVVAFVGLWIGSMPVVAQALIGSLEDDYPSRTVAGTPTADAIVILGGSVAGRYPPKRPLPALNSASSRVWHAAELYRAGKAKWVVIAAGSADNDGEQVEADAIAEMLGVLGVPDKAVLRDAHSRNTRENAANVRVILERLGVRRILLVTSAQHMRRAVTTFNKAFANSGITLMPVPTDVQVVGTENSPLVWIPSPSALLGVTRALKEYAGMLALAII